MTRRNTELLLLCLAAPFVILLFSMVLVKQDTALSFETLAVPLGLFGAFIVAHIATRFFAKTPIRPSCPSYSACPALASRLSQG